MLDVGFNAGCNICIDPAVDADLEPGSAVVDVGEERGGDVFFGGGVADGAEAAVVVLPWLDFVAILEVAGLEQGLREGDVTADAVFLADGVILVGDVVWERHEGGATGGCACARGVFDVGDVALHLLKAAVALAEQGHLVGALWLCAVVWLLHAAGGVVARHGAGVVIWLGWVDIWIGHIWQGWRG